MKRSSEYFVQLAVVRSVSGTTILVQQFVEINLPSLHLDADPPSTYKGRMRRRESLCVSPPLPPRLFPSLIHTLPVFYLERFAHPGDQAAFTIAINWAEIQDDQAAFTIAITWTEISQFWRNNSTPGLDSLAKKWMAVGLL